MRMKSVHVSQVRGFSRVGLPGAMEPSALMTIGPPSSLPLK